MSKTIEVYECDGCGLCCRHLLVEAYALDVAREPRIEQAVPLKRSKKHPLHILESCWILMGPDASGCPFLTAANRCDIYPTRPNTCVGFAAGSAKCQELRRDHGLSELRPVKREKTVMAEVAAGIFESEQD